MNEANIVLTHFTSAAMVVYIINALKSAPWFPWLQKEWNVLNRVASVAAAFFTSIGISYVWTAHPDGTHQLVLDIPTWSVLLLSLWHWLNQFAMQETIHQMTKRKVVLVPAQTEQPPVPVK